MASTSFIRFTLPLARLTTGHFRSRVWATERQSISPSVMMTRFPPSRDQTFVPLDSHMLYTRKSINLGESVQANGFIAVEANRKSGKSLFHMFDTPVSSEFRMIGQNLNRDLEPGGSVETFIPSEEDARNLKGDLVWRFQFRKGYNPMTKRGVTTLIDVRFNSKDITNENGA